MIFLTIGLALLKNENQNTTKIRMMLLIQRFIEAKVIFYSFVAKGYL